MINEISFRRFMNLRQLLFEALLSWGPADPKDGVVEVKIIFDSCENTKGQAFDPYQKTRYEIEIVGENHDGFYCEGDNFEELLDLMEERIKEIKK